MPAKAKHAATPPEPEAAAAPTLPEGATVQSVGDPNTPGTLWRLVTVGTWQISIAPDGLLMLPRHLHPRECPDFIAALSAAAIIGATVVTENAARGARDNRRLPPARAIVREGPDRHTRTPGLMPMLTTPGPNPPPRTQAGNAAIGRPHRNGRRSAPPGAMI
jgi:hypothetical protein